MTDPNTKDIEGEPLLKNSTIQNSTTKKTNPDEKSHLSFANYFEDPEDEAPDCGTCIGETFLPCIPTVCCGQECCRWRAPPFFWTVNYVALIGHLINTIITIIYFFTKDDVVYDLKEISESWTNETNTTMCTTNMPANSFDARPIQAGNTTMCISYSSTTTATVSLFNLIIWFHLLSFLFQTLAMFDWNFPIFCCCSKTSSGKRNGFGGLFDSLRGCRCIRKRYVDEVIQDGTNMLRMIEYSISATLMQVAIALVLGIDSRLEIISIAALTILVMLLGLIAEQLKNTMFKTAWFSHLLGWFAMGAVWFLIFQKFNHSVEMSTADGGDGPPEFVFTLILTIAIMYMAFGLLQFFQLIWITLYSTTGPLFNKNIETGYNLMSLTSKTFLGIFLLANVLFAPRTVNQCLPKTSDADWNELGCGVTMFNASNVTDLGDIEPFAGFRSCKIKCEENGTHFQVISEENRCKAIDNQSWWASKGCVVGDPAARTVSDLQHTVNEPLWSSCEVTCHTDNGDFEVYGVKNNACTDVDTPVGCEPQDCTAANTPYAGCTSAACTAVDTPYAGCTVQACTTDATTPHAGCAVQACTTDGATPYPGCTVQACTSDNQTPYPGCDPHACTTDLTTPYPGCDPHACTAFNVPYPGCTLAVCTEVNTPYEGCTAPACTAVNTPYSGCTVNACTTDAHTPYPGCTVHACTAVDTPYVGCYDGASWAAAADAAAADAAATSALADAAQHAADVATHNAEIAAAVAVEAAADAADYALVADEIQPAPEASLDEQAAQMAGQVADMIQPAPTSLDEQAAAALVAAEAAQMIVQAAELAELVDALDADGQAATIEAQAAPVADGLAETTEAQAAPVG